jgi:hypothetical protein
MSASVSVKSQNSQSNNGNVGGKVKKDKVKRSFKVI